MSRKRILWLASWYPNKIDAFTGDFIQRHAYAASLYNDIHVIYLQPVEKNAHRDQVHVEVSKKEGLTEQIIYFKKANFILGRAITFLRWLKLFRAAIKEYINDHGQPRFVHVQVPMKAGLLALWAKRRYDIPFIVTEHWAIYNQVAPDAFNKRSIRHRYLAKSIIAKADKLLVVSKDLGESINKWVTKREFQVIPNVVNTNFFNFHPERNQQRFRFIHVSTMVPYQKRPKDLVDAFIRVREEFSDIDLYMVGPTPGDIYQHVQATGQLNQSVFFTGEISYADVAKELQKSNVFVLCSQYENQPCSILEALCCGLPVIATNVGGIPEVINASNGILVEPQDVNGLANAMKKIMKDYHQFQREKISAEAKNKFNYNVVGNSFHDFYGNDDSSS